MTHGDRGQLVLDLGRQDRAGRVARIAEEERLGPRRDGGFDGGGIEGEVVLEAGGDVATTPPAKTIAGTYATYEGSWRMTSSPGSHVARRARSTASDAPTVIRISVAGS